MPDRYRQAASVLVLKPSQVCLPAEASAKEGLPGGECKDIYYILLLHKPRKNDAWQLPQGGVEAGETIEQAAMRELMEEAGISSAKVFGTSEHQYQYDFPDSYRRFRNDEVCGQCIHYVYALVPKDVQVKVDGKEIDDSMWVTIEEIGPHVKRETYRSLVEQLYSEALSKLSQKALN